MAKFEEINNWGVTVRYPKVGFAFNPLRVYISDYDSEEELIFEVTLREGKKVRLKRELMPGQKELSYELSGVAKALFDRMEFPNVQQEDRILLKPLYFSIYTYRKSLVPNHGPQIYYIVYSETIHVLWGALQIGEKFKQNRRLTYFEGLPFTIPFFLENETVLKVNGIEYTMNKDRNPNKDVNKKTFQPVKLNCNIDEFYTVLWNNAGKPKNWVAPDWLSLIFHQEWSYWVFNEAEFNNAFGPQRVLLEEDMTITIERQQPSGDGVYLRWINRFGEYNYYYFEKGVKSSSAKSVDITYDNVYYSTDLSPLYQDGKMSSYYHFGVGKSIGKNLEESRKLFAPLVDRDTYEMLIGITESPVVDMFMGYKEEEEAKLEQWMSVGIQDGSFARSADVLQDFEIFLVPNKRQIQTL